jgi:sulfate adenylyltransferase subunit 1
MPVQRVIRPDHNYRGFAGQIAAGTIRKGDAIVALPSGRSSRVASITTFDGELDEASAPQSVALTLEEELDISRGDVIAEPERPPQSASAVEAALVWFDGSRLEDHKPYLLKHGTQTFQARIRRVLYRTNIQTLEAEAVHALGMNDIGVVEIATTRPIFFDSYADNRATGSFILIDPATNATAAAGMIRRGLSDETTSAEAQNAALLLVQDAVQAGEVEQVLLDQGVAVVRTRVASKRLWQALLRIGVVVLIEGIASADAHALGEELHIEDLNISDRTPEELLHELREKGLLSSQKGSQR